jgi:hypothetical protein
VPTIAPEAARNSLREKLLLVRVGIGLFKWLFLGATMNLRRQNASVRRGKERGLACPPARDLLTRAD